MATSKLRIADFLQIIDKKIKVLYFYSMPTALRIGPYRFFFYAGDRHEPPHIHIERDQYIAKFWLDPVRLERSGGFSRKEINQMQELVTEYRATLLRSWNEFFDR